MPHSVGQGWALGSGRHLGLALASATPVQRQRLRLNGSEFKSTGAGRLEAQSRVCRGFAVGRFKGESAQKLGAKRGRLFKMEIGAGAEENW